MMCRSKVESGFSLIELIVVLAIVGVLMTLTGGLFQKNISQQEKLVEIEKIHQLFKTLSYKAYYGNGPYKVRFQESEVSIMEDSTTMEPASEKKHEIITKVIAFKQLTFVAQDIEISTKGAVTPNYFSFIERNNIKIVNIKVLYNEPAKN